METIESIKSMYEDLSNSREMLSQIVAKKHFKDIFSSGEQESLRHLEKEVTVTEESMKPFLKIINQKKEVNIFYPKVTKHLPK